MSITNNGKQTNLKLHLLLKTHSYRLFYNRHTALHTTQSIIGCQAYYFKVNKSGYVKWHYQYWHWMLLISTHLRYNTIQYLQSFFGFARTDSMTDIIVSLKLYSFGSVLHNATVRFCAQSSLSCNGIVVHFNAFSLF